MPPEIADAAAANPEAFADAMATGMDAFQGAMNDGGDMGAAFEAMGDVMGPIMQDMGVSPEAFDAAGDAVGSAIGGGMHMGPADAGGPEMGAMIQDAVGMMLPEGTDMPAPVMEACMDMGQGFVDAGCAPHDMAGEMMPPPGDPGFPFPCDPAGDCIVPPGEPAACPPDACQPPPMDGACADIGGAMMPPEGGYDHAPMPADAVMPPPMPEGGPPPAEGGVGPEGFPIGEHPEHGPGDTAAVDPAAGMEGMAPGLDGMAPPDPTGALSGAENIAPAAEDDGGMGALAGALDGAPAGGPEPAMPDAADAAIGAAMDGAMEQGGAPAPADPSGDAAGDPGAATPEDDGPEVDPSAGMG